jgi:hypothetical protein
MPPDVAPKSVTMNGAVGCLAPKSLLGKIVQPYGESVLAEALGLGAFAVDGSRSLASVADNKSAGCRPLWGSDDDYVKSIL